MEKILNAIRMREKLPRNMLILSSFLKMYGVPGFENECLKEMLSRIDVEHVCLHFSGDLDSIDLLVDEIGMSENVDVLGKYVSEEILLKAKDHINAKNALICSYNEYFDVLHNISEKTLKALLKSPYIYFPPERVKKNCAMLQAELDSRKPVVKIKKNVKRLINYFRHKCLKAFAKLIVSRNIHILESEV